MKSSSWYRIIVCGVGGQGVLLTSRILCDAAVRAGVPVVSGEIRNMAQRGGAVHATVVLGGARSTLVPRGGADAVVAFEPMEAARLIDYMSDKTLAIVNNRPVVPFTLSVRGLPYPPLQSLLSTVRERCGSLSTFDATAAAIECGSIRVLNMVMLGALGAVPHIPIDSRMVEKVIEESTPGATRARNLAAFRAGTDLARADRHRGAAGAPNARSSDSHAGAHVLPTRRRSQ